MEVTVPALLPVIVIFPSASEATVTEPAPIILCEFLTVSFSTKFKKILLVALAALAFAVALAPVIKLAV